jgi:Tfp pilus assembly protein PilP
MPKEPEVKPLEPLAYSPKGRRDPFAAPATAEGAKGLTVAAVKLVGVVQGRRGRLALVEAPDGLGYILKAGDQIGDGRVVDIGRDSLTFSVAARPGVPPTPIVKRLRTE